MSTDRQPEHVGDRIRFVRSSRGWSQSHLADLVGMKKAQLSRYEVGVSKPRPEVLHRIAAALGVSSGWLQGDDVPFNEHEVVDKGGKIVPMSNETFKLLLQLATLHGRTLSEELDVALQYAADNLKAEKDITKPENTQSTKAGGK